MLIEIIPVGPFQCNCIILGDEISKKGIIIDPGDEADKILDIVKQNNLEIIQILHTHAHLDHIGATRRVHQETQAPILIHKDDLWLYENLKLQGDLFGIPTEPVKPVNQFLSDGDIQKFGEQKLITLHTPGHTPGSVSFQINEKVPVLFSGDTLFQGSIGRTDLWGGSYETILKSIENRLLPLEESTKIFPGHGPQTTLWNEKKTNPFLKDLGNKPII